MKGDDRFHYVIRKKQNSNKIKTVIKDYLYKNEDLLDKKKKLSLNLDEAVNQVIKLQQNFEEKDALSLGVSTIWVDDYKKGITKVLKQIRG